VIKEEYKYTEKITWWTACPPGWIRSDGHALCPLWPKTGQRDI